MWGYKYEVIEDYTLEELGTPAPYEGDKSLRMNLQNYLWNLDLGEIKGELGALYLSRSAALRAVCSGAYPEWVHAFIQEHEVRRVALIEAEKVAKERRAAKQAEKDEWTRLKRVTMLEELISRGEKDAYCDTYWLEKKCIDLHAELFPEYAQRLEAVKIATRQKAEQMEKDREEKKNWLNSMRIMVPEWRRPKLDVPVQLLDQVVVFTNHGRVFERSFPLRSIVDPEKIIIYSGMVCYSYHRPATPEEIEAHGVEPLGFDI